MGQVLFESDGLLVAECFEIPVPGILLEAAEGLGDRVHGRFAVSFRLTQKGQIAALDSFVCRIVFFHGRLLLI